MSIAELSIKKSSLTWFFMGCLAIGGIYGFSQLPKLEDPEFIVKEAKIYLSYPGSSAKEMEDEVTHPIEVALQELPYVDRVTSITNPGTVEITFKTLDKYRKNELQQIWDEVRKKVNETMPKLPPGVLPPLVLDDYGDVYGLFYGIIGEGYTYKEIKDFTDIVKRELLLVDGIKKVAIGGIQEEKIYVEIAKAKLKNLEISFNELERVFKMQNFVTPAGKLNVGDEYIRSEVIGKFNSVEDIENLVISATGGKLILFKDIGEVKRQYYNHPKNKVFINSSPALTIGLAVDTTKDITKTIKLVESEFEHLRTIKPPGMKVIPIYNQAKEVEKSVRDFVYNLVGSLAIVLAVLLVSMGWRSGVLIGAVLLLIMGGTTLSMYYTGIPFHRISLGALIIALGMLVDAAIVVAEGMLVRIQEGKDKIESAVEVVTQTKTPMLIATIIAAVAFSPIGFSRDSTGEYAGSLFWVILISLLISWVLAITVTPLLGNLLYRKEKLKKGEGTDPYNTKFFKIYKKGLDFGLKRKIPVMVFLSLLLLSSIVLFKFVKKSFFPDMTTPIVFMDYYRQEGTDINTVEKDILEISKFVKAQPNVEQVNATIGSGFTRFILNYSPETPNQAYGQLLIRTKEEKDIAPLSQKIITHLQKHFSNADFKIKRLALGPSPKAKIVARFSGRDPEVLRSLSDSAIKIFRKTPNTTGIRTDWREKVKTLAFEYSQDKAQFSGVSRSELKDSLLINFTGKEVGLYREGINLLPILLRAPEEERMDAAHASNIEVWTDSTKSFVPISQVVSQINTNFESNIIGRRNRRKTIEVLCDPQIGFLASQIFEKVRPEIEKIPLPPGYKLEWGGEYEDSIKGQKAVSKSIPAGAFLMFILTIFLFKDLRQPMVIWLCLPMAIIGVTYGLLITGNSFGFMCLLGILSLSGMLIKNAIILIDEFDFQIAKGKDPLTAIVDSSVSKVRPVALTALTTAMGLIPFLVDAFFKDMAITIIAGLMVATVLTLLVIPIIYCMVFKIPYKELETNS
jgi:multidrug efflux pump subunit AcrB